MAMTRNRYLDLLREVILGDCPPEQVILLEIKPHEQKTRIDFYCTQDYLGIQPVCLTELIQEGRKLYYLHPATGKKTHIRRIYNRVIFDELHPRRPVSLGSAFVDIRQDLDVEWVAHPNWFYRVSKFTLPFIHHPFVPPTFFLNELKQPPADLENYVLKPLFSFAGQGVVIDPQPADLDVKGPGKLDPPAQGQICRSHPHPGHPRQGRDPDDVPLEGRRTRAPPRHQPGPSQQRQDDRRQLQQGQRMGRRQRLLFLKDRPQRHALSYSYK